MATRTVIGPGINEARQGGTVTIGRPAGVRARGRGLVLTGDVEDVEARGGGALYGTASLALTPVCIQAHNIQADN